MRPQLSAPAFAGVVAVVLFQVACPIVIARHGSDLAVGQFATQSDAARYRTITREPGTPYRDFEVEYPPAALGVFRAVGTGTFDGFRERLFALQVACQALVVFLLFRFWSRRAMWSYLALSAPMLFVVYNGFDLVGVAIAVSAATLVRRRHPVAGAVGYVIGAFTKVWPVVLLPSLLAQRKVRAFGVGVATGVAGLVAWSVWGGAGALGQVLTYRGARGWEYESLPGSLLRVATHSRLRLESGSWRLGSPPHAISVLLSLAAVAGVGAIWWLASRRPGLPDGIAETAAIVTPLVLGTLLSPQFLIWPLPFVAIAAAAGATRLERWAAAVSVLTLCDWIFFDPHRPALLRSEIVILGRNIALAGLLAVALIELCKPRVEACV